MSIRNEKRGTELHDIDRNKYQRMQLLIGLLSFLFGVVCFAHMRGTCVCVSCSIVWVCRAPSCVASILVNTIIT